MMAQLLEYENQVFLDAFHEDGLIVMARGLGIERIFLSFLKIYCDSSNLVLVLNATDTEEEYYTEQLQAAGVKPLPRSIDADCTTDGRTNIYLEGGVLFITSRILVVDMLVERIPIHLVTGILVYKAHRVIESCQEAFILRLYRQKNKTGFIKAFSDSPHSFTAGFCHVERVMKSLFVRKLYLWPRFQSSVISTFEQNKIDVVEIQVPLTDAMLACQTSLLSLIDACIKELKRCNRLLDTDDITVEYAIIKDFDKILRRMTDPIWHQLGPKTRQLIADLRTLRVVLQSSEKVFGSNAGWLFMDAAENLFVNAKKRLYKLTDNKSKKQKTATDDQATASVELQFEECPKWQALTDVLEEIEEDCKRMSSKDSAVHRILIAARDDNACAQIKEYLCDGSVAMLMRQYSNLFLAKKSTSLPSMQSENGNSAAEQLAVAGQERLKRKRPGGRGSDAKNSRKQPTRKTPSELTLTQMAESSAGGIEKGTTSSSKIKTDTEDVIDDQLVSKLTNLPGYHVAATSPLTVLHSLRGLNESFSFVKTLEELMPSFVILYDADMAAVRNLEVFKASHPQHSLRVYFLMYAKSVEEQRYLTMLRTEKESFEYLIRQKAIMVIPEEREGKMDDDPYLSRDPTPAAAAINTRKGGLKPRVPQKIIVDMREFRSELPSLIHRRGIDIDPVTLEVGDYILTPDICVERKSVSDLIGSLNNGRLYNQCVAMCRSYKWPVLLIEFDPSKAFILQDRYPMYGDINSHDSMSQLTLLTIHFPRLRILWCPSPYTTAELFEELKVGRSQPMAVQAMAVTSASESGNEYVGKFNSAPQDMLMKMPGINCKNVYAVMNRVESIAQLVTLTVDELTDILSNSSNAKQLYDFIHSDGQLRTKSLALPDPVKQDVVAVARTSGRGNIPPKRSKK